MGLCFWLQEHEAPCTRAVETNPPSNASTLMAVTKWLRWAHWEITGELKANEKSLTRAQLLRSVLPENQMSP